MLFNLYCIETEDVNWQSKVLPASLQPHGLMVDRCTAVTHDHAVSWITCKQ